jgi:excisionase family DNA binding protein
MAKDSAKSQRELISDIDSHQNDPLLHLSTVGRCIGRHGMTIRRWIDEGILKAVRVGTLHKVRKSEVAKLLEHSTFADDDVVMERFKNLKGDE